jgi:lysine 2,3-aminomutase
MPVPGITHRYPDRVLFYTTHNCPVYCRHCLRKRKVSDPVSAAPKNQLDLGVRYIAEHPEVRDVLVSGGDPLTFSDDRLSALLLALRRIPHVEIIRIATRNPVTLPQRVTPELAAVLRGLAPIYVHTHFNHLRECTPEAEQALTLLADAGCVLNNQMVLLRGVNEDPQMVKRMNQWLLARRCQPYYIFQCDAAQGISHFRTPIASGLKIIDNLRGWTSGMAVPQYVVDLPGGGGKVPLLPERAIERDGKRWTFENYRGQRFLYEEG